MGKYPKDVDGDVFRRLEEAGFDFSKPAFVEFYCYASDTKSAGKISEIMNNFGFEAKVWEDEDSSISVYFGKTMLLTYNAVIAEQEQANQRLVAFDTYCDGWMVGHSPEGHIERKLT